MLNFDNMLKVTREMQTEAFKCAEDFLQKIFDSIKFDAEWPVLDEREFYSDEFPESVDNEGIFANVHFYVEFSCFGKLRIFFDTGNQPQDYYTEVSILQEVLLKNGFTKVESEDVGTSFVRNVF